MFYYFLRTNSTAVLCAGTFMIRLLFIGGNSFSDEYILSRQEAVTLGLSNSTALEIEELHQAAQKRQWRLQIRDYFPRIEFGMHLDDAVSVGAPDSRTKRIFITLEQPLYKGGTLHANRILFREEIRLREKQLQLKRNEIADTIWRQCSLILIHQKKRTLQHELITLLKKKREIMLHEFELGKVTELSLLDMELSIHQAALALEEADIQLSEFYYTLQQLLLLPDNSSLTIKDSIDDTYRGIDIRRDITYLKAYAQQNNTDLQLQRYTLRKEEKMFGLSKPVTLPSFSLSSTFFFEGSRFPLHVPGMTLQVNITFSNPLFPGTLSAGIGNTGDTRYNRSFHTQTELFGNVTGFVDRRIQGLTLQKERNTLLQAERNLLFAVEHTVRSYQKQRNMIKMLWKEIQLLNRKRKILTNKISIGSVRNITLIEEDIQFNTRKMNLLEQVLTLMEIESKLEQLIGSSPGELHKIAGAGENGT